MSVMIYVCLFNDDDDDDRRHIDKNVIFSKAKSSVTYTNENIKI